MSRTAARTAVIVANEAGAPEETVRVPAAAHKLAGFRSWAGTQRFPETGRIDYLGGDIELDMSPEDLHTHGTLKAALAAELFSLVAKPGRGYVFIDRTRVTSPEAELSAEPDLVVVLFPSLDQGRVRQVPAARKGPGRFIELEGAPDLVIEILSDTSEKKDTERLPPRYARAGIPELWLLDARGGVPRFDVQILEGGAYRSLEADRGGWISSPALGGRFRLKRHPTPHAGWLYSLEHKLK